VSKTFARRGRVSRLHEGGGLQNKRNGRGVHRWTVRATASIGCVIKHCYAGTHPIQGVLPLASVELQSSQASWRLRQLILRA
jgi:hypothetical protein